MARVCAASARARSAAVPPMTTCSWYGVRRAAPGSAAATRTNPRIAHAHAARSAHIAEAAQKIHNGVPEGRRRVWWTIARLAVM